MTKKRKDAVKEMNARIHKNTIAWAKKMGEKRRKRKMEAQMNGMDITNRD